ncbi:MAG: hypothetical protein A2X80_04485 [Geobacteraceae bacterium GWB2_52_12]|nr:MAG: hypothetical protein A2X80_04485 [Geobacteraceae bacterium GWB2_52_12]
MKVSELVARLQAAIAEHGDVKVFAGDMKPVDGFEVVDTITEDPEERKQYGEKYLYIYAPD